MRFILPALGLICLFPFSTSFAKEGGWHSSGGELFRGAKNPWFVSNTPEVKYCLKVDTASVNASETTVRTLIQAGFTYWKNEFRRSIRPSAGSVDLATQNFTEVDCSLGVADIDFLVGYGTLKDEQIAYLENPAKFIGVTVRTDYDEVNLRAKGFIYISSDKGPKAYSTTDLRRYGLIQEAWKHDQLLFYAILHELGHVFGLPHTGAGLMSEVFLEQLLNVNIHQAFLTQPVESFFFPTADVDQCNLLSGPEKAWLGANLDTECIRLQVGGPYLPINVFSKRGSMDWEKIGQFTNIQPNLFDIRHRPAVHLELPEGQKVFSERQAAFRSFMVGGMFFDGGLTATYQAVSSPIPKAAYIRATSSSLHVMGTVSAQPKVIFGFNSWIATKLYLSTEMH